MQQAQAEGLTLCVADNTTGYFGVYVNRPGKPFPFQARVWRGGKDVSLGVFERADEAALCVARSPEGQAAATRAAAAPPLTSEEARQQAQAEGLTLRVADNRAGYFGVSHQPGGLPKPYQAKATRSGKQVSLGSFATAEEAALCVARSPEAQAAAKWALAARTSETTAPSPPQPPPRPAAAPPLTREEALLQAQAEGLVLRVAGNSTGFFGVSLLTGRSKPYQAKVGRQAKVSRVRGEQVHLGLFATAEEAALSVARSPEGQAAARRAAVVAVPLTSKEAQQQAQAEGLTLAVAENTSGFFGVRFNGSCKTKPHQALVRYDGKDEYLGSFATAEEAALCVARSSEGRQAVAKRARAALTSEPVVFAPATDLTAAATAATVALRANARANANAARGQRLQQARDAAIGTIALDIIYEAAGAAANELSAEVAAEVMAGIAMGL
eukprot:scaffold26950_cov65-Phaeocystis_antarctica.AAC.1